MGVNMEKSLNMNMKLIEKYLPESVYLSYIDYRDSLDESIDIIQKSLHKNSLGVIYEWFYDNNPGYEYEGLDYYKDELIKEIKSDYPNDHDKIDLFFEKYKSKINDLLYERDESNPVKDIIKNTSSFVMHYAITDIDTYYNSSPAEFRLERMKIKKLLSIKDSTYDNEIDLMLLQAGYGGTLVVYFNVDFEKMIDEKNEFKTIEFFNEPHIAIIDISNGSGSHCSLPGHLFKLPFKRENLFLDEYFKYNYTYSVCGMSSDWCVGTKIMLSCDEPTGTECVQENSLQRISDTDKKYEEIFKNGSCSFGDMDITRHRKVIYINNFPCGNKCLDCGTFWID